MKVSVKEILEQTFEGKHGQWNYYSGKSFTEIPVTSEEKSKEFIKSFFKLSGKGGPKLNEQIDKLGSRSIHVVSAFLLGHYLYQNTIFKNKIDKEIAHLKKDLELTSDVTFSFMWFLTCLFHDIGYNMETNQFNYESYEELANEEDMPEISGIPKFYNAVYKNYFEYRIKEHCKNDHGIMMGHIMYKELCRIREYFEKYEKSTKLCWEKNLEKIYAFCSWNVLGHNIWYGDNSDCYDLANYSKYKIIKLLNNGVHKIKSKNHPFFFLFCLVDTIEPYKRILNFNMLEQVFMEIKDDKIIISTDLKCKCGKTIIEQAEGLNIWLTDTLKTGNSVEIYLNN